MPRCRNATAIDMLSTYETTHISLDVIEYRLHNQ